MSVAARVIARGYIISSLPCGEEKSQNPSHALLGNHRRQSQQSRLSWGCILENTNRSEHFLVKTCSQRVPFFGTLDREWPWCREVVCTIRRALCYISYE